MRRKAEHGTHCELCKKKRPSRIFYRMINQQWLRLCKICWNTKQQADQSH